MRMDAQAIVLADVDALISELETQYEKDRMMPKSEVSPTNGCTNAATCTGTCPCGDE